MNTNMESKEILICLNDEVLCGCIKELEKLFQCGWSVSHIENDYITESSYLTLTRRMRVRKSL